MIVRLVCLGVFLLALARFSYQASEAGIASGQIDPIGQIEPQDEAVYSSTTIRMVTEGDWLTPRFLGRYVLYKPPLLYWLSGLSCEIFGISALSLRLPSLLAGAAACALVFAWVWRVRSWQAAVVGALLLGSNRLLHTLSRLALADAGLLAFGLGAMFTLLKDPRLASRAAVISFGVLAGLAIMIKGIAGLLPLVALGLFALWRRGGDGPTAKRVALAIGISLAVAVPWHLYQLAVHPRWFWSEYVVVEILRFGLGKPPQTSSDGPAVFYLRRLFWMDPVLCVLAAGGIPWLVREVRARSAAAGVLVCWMLVVVGSVFVFQYRNITYWLPLVAGLSIAAAAYGPLAQGRRAGALAAVLCLVFAGKAWQPEQTWGLSFDASARASSATTLQSYCERNRPRELVIVSPDDEFYSAALPLARVRYCFYQTREEYGWTALDFRELGISVTVDQFAELSRWRGVFAERLRHYGVDSDEPIATGILARSFAEVRKMIATRPEIDYLLPEMFVRDAEAEVSRTHAIERVAGGRLLLLSRAPADPGVTPRQGWSCRL